MSSQTVQNRDARDKKKPPARVCVSSTCTFSSQSGAGLTRPPSPPVHPAHTMGGATDTIKFLGVAGGVWMALRGAQSLAVSIDEG